MLKCIFCILSALICAAFVLSLNGCASESEYYRGCVDGLNSVSNFHSAIEDNCKFLDELHYQPRHTAFERER